MHLAIHECNQEEQKQQSSSLEEKRQNHYIIFNNCNWKLKSTLSSGKMFVNTYQLSKIILVQCKYSKGMQMKTTG